MFGTCLKPFGCPKRWPKYHRYHHRSFAHKHALHWQRARGCAECGVWPTSCILWALSLTVGRTFAISFGWQSHRRKTPRSRLLWLYRLFPIIFLFRNGKWYCVIICVLVLVTFQFIGVKFFSAWCGTLLLGKYFFFFFSYSTFFLSMARILDDCLLPSTWCYFKKYIEKVCEKKNIDTFSHFG